MKAFKIALPTALIALLPFAAFADNDSPRKHRIGAGLFADLEQMVDFKSQSKKQKAKRSDRGRDDDRNSNSNRNSGSNSNSNSSSNSNSNSSSNSSSNW